ncbi:MULTISPECIES: response regulator [Legionella]|uniref:Response regulator n=1 Tax=Legionella resiliens TaxID=2905958 RepID=A0ABS8WYN6_9GAMM|nr:MULTISPECIES: response regulator [unclassified Legionella]MCE0722439.1 response regulator [Legionella sp. 9fVS26]MCE3531593.1 response regulator [Legionella sp. 8cVS16]QLZ67612.1 response regulator [Legionella sp. PC1000]
MSSKELKKILYAEDEADIRAIAQIALEDIGGFTVKYCSNGKKILEAAKEYIPDLLLLDVMMPEMDGPTTLRELRKNPDFIKIPVIFMTAKIQIKEIEEYKAIGAIDVIKKPFDPLTLATSIKNAWLKYNG